MELIVQFKNGLYFPNMNQFIVGQIGDKNVLLLYYWFLLFMWLLMTIYYMLFVYSPNRRQRITFSRLILLSTIGGLLLFAGIQQCHQFDFYKHEKNIYGGKSEEEKNIALFGGLFQFPQASKNILQGRHQGKIISDFDFSISPFMSHHRTLSYFFYPEVSLRLDNQSPKDILFLYSKMNPSEHIPEEYQILMTTDDQKFLLAITKQSLQ